MVRWNAVEDTRGLYLCNVFYTEPMQQQRIAGTRTETEEGASVNFVFTGVLFDSRLSRMKDFTNKYHIYIHVAIVKAKLTNLRSKLTDVEKDNWMYEKPRYTHQ